MPKFCIHCGCEYEYEKEGNHDDNVVICPKTGLPLTQSENYTQASISGLL